ncbi:MAG: methyltransferase domain-containing protein [Deltaproteobacteria bacterium]|nr:methyltransferase domain-containing protein [Deltaproteobacteria bacterium]
MDNARPVSQILNRDWWEENPMTYDWEGTLRIEPGTREWYEELDRRFLESAYYAKGTDGSPFGRFLKREHVAGKEVLEVGCGMGTHAAMLVRAGARLTAIDLTSRSIEMTRQRFKLFGLSGRVEQADAERLPFQSNTFDLVWSWGVIHHSSSTEKCLAEIRRVLRPGGRVVVMVYYRPSLVYYLHCALIRGIFLGQLLHRSLDEIYMSATDGFYARIFTKRELKSLFEKHYEQVAVEVIGLKAELFPIPRCRLKAKMEEYAPDWLASAILSRLGSMVVVEATKRRVPAA